jgi:hypothetical protein
MDAKGIAITKEKRRRRRRRRRRRKKRYSNQNTYRKTIFLSKTLRDVQCCCLMGTQRSPKPCSSNACRNLGIESQHFTAITLGHNPRK